MKRIAIVNKDKCRPKLCNLECKRGCPVVLSGGEECIKIENEKAIIDETLCTGCGICSKTCPFGAIQIINLPDELDKQPIHQYGVNGFRIFNLPIIQENKVTGIIGRNGIGKTTVINILSGELKANFGEYFFKELNDEEYFKELNDFFKGTVLQNYFLKLKNKEVKVSYKPQNILSISKAFKGKVKELLLKIADEEDINNFAKIIEIENLLDKNIETLSGGELQRIAIAATLFKKDTNFFVFDEISNYLDIYQRLKLSKIILDKIKDKTSLVVEHDLIVLDYLVDYVHIQYGVPGAYGVLTGIKSAKKGINDYLSGYSKEENIRFRDKPIVFDKDSFRGENEFVNLVKWEEFKIDRNKFKLEVEKGNLRIGEILGVVGRNGIGKSTFIEYIARSGFQGEKFVLSYKPQLVPTSENLVVEELSQFDNFNDTFYQIYVLEPLMINDLLEKRVNQLSGGELQRFAIAKVLLKEADIYLLDEPTAFLDVEDRLKVSKMLRNFIEVKKKSAIIIDHDLIFIDYLSDRLLVFEGTPAISGHALTPMTLKEGMNLFLKDLKVTFRRDETNRRPRINKEGSVKDAEQKSKGEYYSYS